MIELSINETGEPHVTMQTSSPTVYLDHWALREISANNELSTRLIEGIRARRGTLAISWLNLAEFTKITDEKQARNAESLIEGILPQVFLLQVDFAKVIKREKRLVQGASPSLPPADEKFLKRIPGLDPTSVNLLSARNLFNVVRDDEALGQRFNNFGDPIVRGIELFRHRHATDSKFRSAIARPPSGRGTLIIFLELVRALVVDSKTKMTRNHAKDLYHAVVPTAYCDLVLLDRHWETQVNRVRSRFASAGIAVPFAKVFSKKRNGLTSFLNELETSVI